MGEGGERAKLGEGGLFSLQFRPRRRVGLFPPTPRVSQPDKSLLVLCQLSLCTGAARALHRVRQLLAASLALQDIAAARRFFIHTAQQHHRIDAGPPQASVEDQSLS